MGEGGMGAVYEAADLQVGERLVAVKEMSQSGRSQQELAEAANAFEHEAFLLARLQHATLPRVYDYFTEAGCWYLVMEFVEGETLEQRLARLGRPGLPVDEVLRIADQLCTALDFLHRHNPPIIFRDLKPSNIMVAPTGHISLIDFGIARLFKSGQSRYTTAFGSPGYAAPEQYGHAQTTARADIFSLGAVLHQLLTGEDPAIKPFVFSKIRASNPSVPTELEDLIAMMVNLDESKRPVTMAGVQARLRRIVEQMDSIPSTPTPPQPPRSATAPRVLFAPAPSPGGASWRRMLPIGAIVGAFTIILVCCVLATVASLAQLSPQFALGAPPTSSPTATDLPAPTDVPTYSPILSQSYSQSVLFSVTQPQYLGQDAVALVGHLVRIVRTTFNAQV
jgi:serine/threonine protein kinase